MFTKISNVLFFNFIIKFILEGYLELCIVAILNIKEVWLTLITISIRG